MNHQQSLSSSSLTKPRNKQLSVLLVSDFFYPRVGGVEVHIYQLAVSLIRLGLKVTVLTHHHKNRQGYHYMGNGIKVYYNTMMTLYDDTSFPTLYGTLKFLREVCIRESVDIVHCHQSTSVTALECLMHARTLGLNTVYTDHSLFGFGDLAEVNINKVMRSIYTDLDQSISVSNIARDNFIIRSMFHPSKTNVIPNGVDFTKFLPPSQDKPFTKDKITIVSISRQAYRKGTDLLIEVIPEVCKMFPNVNFIIGGNGPKKPLLDNMVESSNLQSRVTLTGALPHNKVRDVMIQGDIYLNTSLTESFCIAIVEAASTGLYTIATDVGGVGEVLPDHMVKLVNAEKKSIIQGIKETIENLERIKSVKNDEYNKVLSNAYSWHKVAHKTVKVYKRALGYTDRSFITRLKRALGIGNVSGVFHFCLIALDYLLFLFLSLIYPPTVIHKERRFNYENYKKYLNKLE